MVNSLSPRERTWLDILITQEPNAKRQKSNVGSALRKKQETSPDYEKGIQYWDGIEASVDGVLGGFGNGVRSPFLALHRVPGLRACGISADGSVDPASRLRPYYGVTPD